MAEFTIKDGLTVEETNKLKVLNKEQGVTGHLKKTSTPNNFGAPAQKTQSKIRDTAEALGLIKTNPGKKTEFMAIPGNANGVINESSFQGIQSDRFAGAFVRAGSKEGHPTGVLDSITSALTRAATSLYNTYIDATISKANYERYVSYHSAYQEDPKRLEKKRVLASYLGRKIEYPALITVLKRDVYVGREEEETAIYAAATAQIEYDNLKKSGASEQELVNARKKMESITGMEKKVMDTDRFILTSVARPDSEKFQIVETFGDPTIIFFDRKTRIYQFTGYLINAENVRWRDDFFMAYDQYLRGTKVAENNYRVLLTFDEIMLEGALLNLDIVQVSDQPYSVAISFNMFVQEQILLAKDKIKVIEANVNLAVDPNVEPKSRWSPPKLAPGERGRDREDERRTGGIG